MPLAVRELDNMWEAPRSTPLPFPPLLELWVTIIIQVSLKFYIFSLPPLSPFACIFFNSHLLYSYNFPHSEEHWLRYCPEEARHLSQQPQKKHTRDPRNETFSSFFTLLAIGFFLPLPIQSLLSWCGALYDVSNQIEYKNTMPQKSWQGTCTIFQTALNFIVNSNLSTFKWCKF